VKSFARVDSHLHGVDLAILGPLPEGLAAEPEQHAEQAPQRDERHVGHDGWDVAGLDGPGGDELAEAVAPDVLVDGDGDEDGAGDGLVAVDGVGGGDGGESGDLDTGAGVTDDDNHLPVPCMLIAKGDDEVADYHDNDIWYHGKQSHFRFADPSVASSQPCRYKIAQRTSSNQTNECTNQDGEVEKANFGRRIIVGRGGEDLGLR